MPVFSNLLQVLQLDPERTKVYIEAGVLGFFAWLIRDILAKWHTEQHKRTQSILLEKVEKVYTPLYFLVGDYLIQSQTNGPHKEALAKEIRDILKFFGHHLKTFHFNFCAELISGKWPSQIEILWHRHSFYLEKERLKYILYKDIPVFEAITVSGAPIALQYWLLKGVDFISAALVWVIIFLGMVLALNVMSPIQGSGLLLLVSLVFLIRIVRNVMLRRSYKAKFKMSNSVKLCFGSKGNEVRRLQSMLQLAGFSVGSGGVDGVFGTCTADAVRKFQTDRGLKATGTVDKKTFATLNKFIENDGAEV